ncbi:MAG TPA: hypothetical protein PKI11_13735 [Candidatus Hydrogenedentes bacterium]|nr:hypothetical protein [Candidatus Hydrogenedentota bacterium]
MTQTTANADSRRPAGPYRRVWGGAVLVLVALTVLSEAFWRAQGFQPSVTDDEQLWALERDCLDGAGPRTVVVLGRSRIQQAFVPEIFEEMRPGYGFVQLAMGGDHPLALLRDIAENTDFAGVILCTVTAPSLLPELWNQQQHRIDYYRREWGPLKRMGRRVKTFLQAHLVILAPELSLREAIPDLLRGRVEPQFLRVSPRRHHRVDYRKVDLAKFTEDQLKTITRNVETYVALEGFTNWPDGLGRIEDWVNAIQRRGGRVVFLCCPTSGDYRAVEDKHFPREVFWDVFAARTAADTIHFEDVPGMREFVCAEGSHLHIEDTHAFTRLLVEELFPSPRR